MDATTIPCTTSVGPTASFRPQPATRTAARATTLQHARVRTMRLGPSLRRLRAAVKRAATNLAAASLTLVQDGERGRSRGAPRGPVRPDEGGRTTRDVRPSRGAPR